MQKKTVLFLFFIIFSTHAATIICSEQAPLRNKKADDRFRKSDAAPQANGEKFESIIMIYKNGLTEIIKLGDLLSGKEEDEFGYLNSKEDLGPLSPTEKACAETIKGVLADRKAQQKVGAVPLPEGEKIEKLVLSGKARAETIKEVFAAKCVCDVSLATVSSNSASPSSPKLRELPSVGEQASITTHWVDVGGVAVRVEGLD